MIKWMTSTNQFRGRTAGLLAGLLITCVVGCEFNSTKPPTAPAATQDKKMLENVVVEGGTEFNFGTMEVGQAFEHVFIVTNKNDKQITIEKGPPSCATCTSFEIEKHILKPGESMKATVKWQIKAENPEFRQFAPLMLSDGQQVRLHVVGKVIKRIVMSPSDKWDLGEMLEPQPKEFQATITSGLLEAFQVESVSNQNPALKVTVAPMTPEKLKQAGLKSGFELNAVLQPIIPIGEFTDTVTINVLDPKPIVMKVDVVALRSGAIQIFGPSWHEPMKALGLGAFDPKTGTSARLNLSTRRVDDELKVVKVKCADPRVSVEIKPDARFKDQPGEFRRYELFVKVAPSNREMVYTHMDPLLIEIETNQPLVGTISLKVRCQALL